MSKKKLVILSGMTGAGKSDITKILTDKHCPNVPLIAGDRQQFSKLFPILSNFPQNPRKMKFLGEFDFFEDVIDAPR